MIPLPEDLASEVHTLARGVGAMCTSPSHMVLSLWPDAIRTEDRYNGWELRVSLPQIEWRYWVNDPVRRDRSYRELDRRVSLLRDALAEELPEGAVIYVRHSGIGGERCPYSAYAAHLARWAVADLGTAKALDYLTIQLGWDRWRAEKIIYAA